MALSIKEILEIGKRQLRDAGVSDFEIDNKLLLCHMLKISTTQLILEYQKTIGDEQCDAYFELLDRRSAGEPLQYITGTQSFMGLDFAVRKGVLIPRQDTETLVEDALEIIKKGTLRGEAFCKPKRGISILDLCCGSGAIGLSISKLCDDCKVTLSDISDSALEVSRENSKNLAIDKRVNILKSDLFEKFKGCFSKKTFNMIISNPPYINSQVIPTLQREVKDFEPIEALDGGNDGMDFYRRIVEDSKEHLKKDGVLIMEIGHDQRERVMALMLRNGFEKVVGLKDLAGNDRVVAGLYTSNKK